MLFNMSHMVIMVEIVVVISVATVVLVMIEIQMTVVISVAIVVLVMIEIKMTTTKIIINMMMMMRKEICFGWDSLIFVN